MVKRKGSGKRVAGEFLGQRALRQKQAATAIRTPGPHHAVLDAVVEQWKRIDANEGWTDMQKVVGAISALSHHLMANRTDQDSEATVSLGVGMWPLLQGFFEYENNDGDKRDAVYGAICDQFLDAWAQFGGVQFLDKVALRGTKIVVRRQSDEIVRAFTRLGRDWQTVDKQEQTYEGKVFVCAVMFASTITKELSHLESLQSFGVDLAILCGIWDETKDPTAFARMCNKFLDAWAVCNGLQPGGMMDLKISGTSIEIRRDPSVSDAVPNRTELTGRWAEPLSSLIRARAAPAEPPPNFGYQQQVRKAEQEVWEDFTRWVEPENFTLQANDCSRVHNLIECIRQYQCYVLNKSGKDLQLVQGDRQLEDILGRHEVMVVRHDWGRALGPAIKEAQGDERGEILPPYPNMLYELRVNGRTLIAMVSTVQQGDTLDSLMVDAARLQLAAQGQGNDLLVSIFYQCATNGHWLAAAPTADLLKFLMDQIEAICVALEAQVATKEVVRAPLALNAKREKKGKPVMRDYHIVDLTKRQRVDPAPYDVNAPKRRSPRLHLRRAHWRHYQNHRTRIDWQLVGDPDLGFIEKEYRL
jgi:hypothetical protein